MEDIAQAITNAQDDLLTARADLREAKELVAALEQDTARIELELAGLRSYADRRGLVDDELGATNAIGGAEIVPISAAIQLSQHMNGMAGPDLILMSRNEAVATVLAQTAAPMNRLAIHEKIALAGRDESLDDVSLSLSGLKRSGRVEKLGRGLWQLADESATG